MNIQYILTYQMSEMTLDHQLQGLCCTCCISSYHRVAGHDLAYGSRARIKTFSSNLQEQTRSNKPYDIREPTHPIGKIFGGKDPTKTFLLIYNQNTIRALGSTELTCLRDSDVLRDSECRTWLQRCDSTLSSRRLVSALGRALLVMGCRDGALAGQLGLYLLSDSLFK